ncbi:hypothetical protein EXIGLDRAFT_764140 [Exidia glandulosa HHB12029]|uniref:Uncharacterized protein n=1 Tax=Exidia glandulosa HHB12029 TaxID=1314781 RepID=A0A165LG05_EXIGL|nr:hypothetical protein EXIGLDRAFT_764140 [Exidia glandulosa HHB12029]
MSFSPFAAPLAVLPPCFPHDVPQDIRQDHKHEKDRELEVVADPKKTLTVATMKTFDALATVCVHDAGDVYAVALDLAKGINVVVASNHKAGVPVHALRRLEGVWHHMQTAARNADVTAIVQRSRKVAVFRTIPEFEALHRSFVIEQYRYSWPALLNRVHNEIARALDVVQRALNQPFTAVELVAAPGFAGYFAELQTAFLQKLSHRLADVTTGVLNCQRGDDDLVALHTLLHGAQDAVQPALREKNKDDKWMSELLDNLSRCSGVPVRGILQDFFALVSAVTHLSSFCHLRAFSRFEGLDVTVLAAKPVQGRFRIDPSHPDVYARVHFLYDASDDGLDLNFESDLEASIERPLRAYCIQLGDNDSVIDIHPEASLLNIVHTMCGAVAYIGTSSLACLYCYRLFQAHNADCEHKFLIRGSNGLPSVFWSAPGLPCSSSRVILQRLHDTLRRDFVRSAGVMYARRSLERRSEGSGRALQ